MVALITQIQKRNLLIGVFDSVNLTTLVQVVAKLNSVDVTILFNFPEKKWNPKTQNAP